MRLFMTFGIFNIIPVLVLVAASVVPVVVIVPPMDRDVMLGQVLFKKLIDQSNHMSWAGCHFDNILHNGLVSRLDAGHI